MQNNFEPRVGPGGDARFHTSGDDQKIEYSNSFTNNTIWAPETEQKWQIQAATLLNNFRSTGAGSEGYNGQSNPHVSMKIPAHASGTSLLLNGYTERYTP